MSRKYWPRPSPQSSALKIAQTKKRQASLAFFRIESCIRDHGGIQTPDRWSRNPVLYSAELRGQFISNNGGDGLPIGLSRQFLGHHTHYLPHILHSGRSQCIYGLYHHFFYFPFGQLFG